MYEKTHTFVNAQENAKENLGHITTNPHMRQRSKQSFRPCFGMEDVGPCSFSPAGNVNWSRAVTHSAGSPCHADRSHDKALPLLGGFSVVMHGREHCDTHQVLQQSQTRNRTNVRPFNMRTHETFTPQKAVKMTK